MKLSLVFWSTILGLLACDDDTERFEVITKLRGIGIQASPSVIANPTENPGSVALTIYALLLKDQQVDVIETFEDQGARYSLPGNITVDSSTATYEELGPLRLFSVQATAQVIGISDTLLESFNGVAKFRYGIRLRSGEEEELMVGDFVVVAADDPALSWQAPTVEWLAPASGTTLTAGTDVELLAQVLKTADEEVKVAWFVSSGKVKNPRGKETTWMEVEGGQQSALVAIFGRKSRTFNLGYRSFEVQ